MLPNHFTQARRCQLVDIAPDLLHYYHLRQVDLDGTETFSLVVVVQTESGGGTLAAYPNPVTDMLTVAGLVSTTFTIVDLVGHRVGGTTTTEAHLPQLDVQNLPADTYFVQAESTGARTKFEKAAP